MEGQDKDHSIPSFHVHHSAWYASPYTPIPCTQKFHRSLKCHLQTPLKVVLTLCITSLFLGFSMPDIKGSFSKVLVTCKTSEYFTNDFRLDVDPSSGQKESVARPPATMPAAVLHPVHGLWPLALPFSFQDKRK